MFSFRVFFRHHCISVGCEVVYCIYCIDIVTCPLMYFILYDFVVQWSLSLSVATIAANPSSDVVAVFTRDSQCEFVYMITDLSRCNTYIRIVLVDFQRQCQHQNKFL